MLMKYSRNVFEVYSGICFVPIQSLSLKRMSVVDIYHSRPGDWYSSLRVLGVVFFRHRMRMRHSIEVLCSLWYRGCRLNRLIESSCHA